MSETFSQVTNLTTVQHHDVIVVEGRNPRMMLCNIEQLADSIEENGVRNPIKVQVVDAEYELVDGHRRLAACKYLFDTKELLIDIPAIVVEHVDESDILIEMMVSNDSEPFAPFEEAILYARLRDEFDMNNDQIARRIGRSISHVSDKLALLRADETVKKAVAEKVISASDANTIIRKSNSDTNKQRELVERITLEGREAVIDKELKRGRLPKPVWNLAENAHDEVWTSMMTLGLEKTSDILEVDDTRTWLINLENVEPEHLLLAFSLGQFEILKQMSHLSTKELWDKLELRLTGK